MKEPSAIPKQSGPPEFWRSVRIRQPVPDYEIEIPPPPNEEVEDSSVWMMLLPAALSAAVLAVLGLVSNYGNMLLFSLPMTLVAALSSATIYLYRKRARERHNEEQRNDYLSLLGQIRHRLQDSSEAQKRAWLAQDPSHSELAQWVTERTRNLWSRSPADDDFLTIRLGIGTRPSQVRAKVSRQGMSKGDLWERASSLARDFASVSEVPVCVCLRESGLTGIAGPLEERRGVLRALVMRLAIGHSPSEVKIAIAMAEADLVQWGWVRWLPHTWAQGGQRRYIAAGDNDAHGLLLDLMDVLSRRQVREQDTNAPTSLPAILLVVTDPLLSRHDAALSRLMEEGPESGIYVVFSGSRVSELPNAIRSFVRLRGPEEGGRPFLSDSESQVSSEFEPDMLTLPAAEALARRMASIRLVEPANEQTIPNMVSLLDLFGAQTIADLQINGRWQQNQRASRTLATPIGIGQGNDKLVFDLHERVHGPNGLVAGMVGTGKSELLQTLVASMCINYSPERVAFVMIDYKGGGMADPFEGLVHCAGTITNLQDPTLARRAITSLNIEARYRQEKLKQSGVNHIDDYQRMFFAGEVDDPLPYLVLIVDEFAEMKADQPDTAAEFVRLARIGRSLGFRIILAMQKPAGIVDAQIEGNTRFRLCLRVAQPEDSQSMLRRADAAFLQGVGRALFQVGVNEIFREFQVGYSGALYDPDSSTRAKTRIDVVHLGGQREALSAGAIAAPVSAPTQLEAVVEAVNRVACAEGIGQARQLWVDPLPAKVDGDGCGYAWSWTGEDWADNERPLRALVGLRDAPEKQAQEPMFVDFGQQAHLALVGAPGTGKTSLLRAMLHSLVRDLTPGRLTIYAYAFGGGELRSYERLPHVGAIVTGDQTERVTRLSRWLRQELRRRQVLLGKHGVGSIEDYSRRTGTPLPSLFVVVDGYTALASEWEDESELLVSLAREGAGVGIHLVLTASSTNSIPYRIRSSIPNILALKLADESEYSVVASRASGLSPGDTPGRGIEPGRPPHLFQAIWYDDRNAPEPLDSLCTRMCEAWHGPIPKSIETLPETVHLAELLTDSKHTVEASMVLQPAIVGLRRDDLESFSLALDAVTALGILGPLRAGKTNLLAALCASLAAAHSPDQLALYVCDSHWQELAWTRKLPHTQAYGRAPEDARQIAQSLQELLQSRQRTMLEDMSNGDDLGSRSLSQEWKHHVLIVDGLFEGDSTISHNDIAALMRSGRCLGVHIVVACDSEGISSAYSDPIVSALKALQHGLMLGAIAPAIFRFSLPARLYDKPMAAGEAYYVERGKTEHLQLALADQALSLELTQAGTIS